MSTLILSSADLPHGVFTASLAQLYRTEGLIGY